MHNQQFFKLIGNTPLIELAQIKLDNNARLFAKLEMFNPTGSIKDRIVLYMIEQAEKNGLLKPGSTIIEATSGNTGASLAAVANIKGYQVIITTPDKTSNEKIAIMRSFGADVRVCPSCVKEGDPQHYLTMAHQLASVIPDSYFLNQYHNLANRDAHYASTGREIWEQMRDKEINYIVAGGSSGGTISGVGKYIKEKSPQTKVVLADPDGSGYYDYFHNGNIIQDNLHPYQVEGVGKDILCRCMDFSLIDNVIRFTDDNAFSSVKELAQAESILAGGSSGGALFAAKKLAESLKQPANIVVVFPDSGMKYLSKIFT